MATNPMQKKARNSMLIGIIIGLIIGCIGIAFFFMQATNYKKQIEEAAANTRKAYALKSNIKSGSNITIDDLVEVSALKDVIPTDYVTLADITDKTIAKLDLTQGLVLSKSMIQETDAKITSDLREQQYNMIVLPQYLDIDDYIDIRITYPNGQDYIVASKKRIKNISEDTIWIDMYEQETLVMTNAIVEAYKAPGSKLYATTYVEPGNQVDATPTYVPSSAVINLMNSDPNIVQEARQALASRYAGLMTRREQDINQQLNAVGEEAQSNLESNLEQEITKSKEARKEYMDSLNGAI
ncbi:MAG: hypothetical protein HFJ27_00025 [Clostridia bacterium]|nr:hypothetical protein [Clostridia bacterium]